MAAVSFPGLGKLPLTGRTVNANDVFIGGVAAIGGYAAVKWIEGKVVGPDKMIKSVPEWLEKALPLVGGAAIAAAAHFGMKKSTRSGGIGVGAVATGLAITALTFVKEKYPALADVVDFRLNGLLVNDPTRGYDGFLVEDRVPQLGSYGDDPGLADLAAVSMGDDDDGFNALASM